MYSFVIDLNKNNELVMSVKVIAEDPDEAMELAFSKYEHTCDFTSTSFVPQKQNENVIEAFLN